MIHLTRKNKMKKYTVVEISAGGEKSGSYERLFVTDVILEIKETVDNLEDVEFYYDVRDNTIYYNAVIDLEIDADEEYWESEAFDNLICKGYINYVDDFIQSCFNEKEITKDNFEKHLKKAAEKDGTRKIEIFLNKSGEKKTEIVNNLADSQIIKDLENEIILKEDEEYQEQYYDEKESLDVYDIQEISNFYKYYLDQNLDFYEDINVKLDR